MDLLHFVYHSSINGLLDCFRFGAIMNSVAMNIGVQVSFLVRVLSGCMTRSGIAGSNGNSILVF